MWCAWSTVYKKQVLDTCRTQGLCPATAYWARTTDKPPFYAYAVRPGVTFTYLGLRTDDSTAVHFGGQPSPNLFVAGEMMAGNVLGQGYTAGVGMSIGPAFGRMAGTRAAAAGIRVPPFSPIFHDETVTQFLQTTEAPWLIKPRAEASTTGIRKVHSLDEAWAVIHSLGDNRHEYLIECFKPGRVYHVDALRRRGALGLAEPWVFGLQHQPRRDGAGDDQDERSREQLETQIA